MNEKTFLTSDALQISRETVRKLFLETDQYERTSQHFGKKTANLLRKPRTGAVRSERPLERVEIDNFLLDVHLVCPRTNIRLGRPWLTLALDHYSGMALGYHLSFASPSTATLLAALRHAILPKNEQLLATLGEGYRWTAFGIPDLLASDNGPDYQSQGGMEAVAALGCEMLYCPPGAPWYKGKVERGGGSLNTRFIHWLPGTTLGSAQVNKEYDAKEHALLTFDEFEKLLLQYNVTIHNHSIVRGKSASPATLWRLGVARWPVRMPESLDALDFALALSQDGVLRQTGIEFKGLYYNSEELGNLWNRSPDGSRVHFKVNPANINSVMVASPKSGGWLRVPCTTPYERPTPLSYHLQLKEVAKRDGFDLAEAQGLALAQQRLSDNIEELTTSRKKKALRAAEAELSRMADEQTKSVSDLGVPQAVPNAKHTQFLAAFAAASARMEETGE